MRVQPHIIDCPGNHTGVREGARALVSYLEQQGIDAQLLMEWELVTVEAGNNAVQYSRPEFLASANAVRIIICLTDEFVEVALTDYGCGFEWPENVSLPEDESEHGRGLFLISQFTDSVRYLRGHQENFLIMRKRRSAPSAESDVQRGASVDQTLRSMTEELVNAYESLSAIFRFSSELSTVEDINQYAKKWLGELMKVTGSSWYVLREVDKNGGSLNLIAADGMQIPCPSELPLEGEAPEFKCVECAAALRQSDILFDSSTPQQVVTGLKKIFGTPLSGVCHPIFIGRNLFGVLTLGTRSFSSALTASQISVAHTFGDLLSVQINNLQNYHAMLRAREVTRELQVAANIQRSLLPQVLPQPRGFQIAAHSSNARHVGGDFYDVISANTGGVLLAVADVMGKGVPAAMFAAIFRSHLRARPDLTATPGKLMMWLNRVLFADLDQVDMFVTAQLAYLDPVSRTLVLASAGHCPAMLVGEPTHQVRALAGEGPPLGIAPHSFYEEESCRLPEGSRLLMYTDGLVDLRDHQNRLLGEDAVASWLIKSSQGKWPATASCESLLHLAASHSDLEHLADDITYLMCTETAAVPFANLGQPSLS